MAWRGRRDRLGVKVRNHTRTLIRRSTSSAATVGLLPIEGTLDAIEGADIASFAGTAKRRRLRFASGFDISPLRPIVGNGRGVLPLPDGEAHGVVVVVGSGGALVPLSGA